MRGLTVTQAAQLLKLKPVTIRAWIANGRLQRMANGKLDPRELLTAHDTRNPTMLALANRRSHRIAFSTGASQPENG